MTKIFQLQGIKKMQAANQRQTEEAMRLCEAVACGVLLQRNRVISFTCRVQMIFLWVTPAAATTCVI